MMMNMNYKMLRNSMSTMSKVPILISKKKKIKRKKNNKN